MKPIYSICVTHFNDVSTLKDSLESILIQIDRNFEVVVVDQRSTDGSRQILQDYADAGKIRLFDMQKRNRGLGRQLAFEKSLGEYIISNIDMDDIYNPVLPNIVELHKQKCQDSLLRVVSPTQTMSVNIAPRRLIERLGGWRDLVYFEDADIFCRAAGIGKYRWTTYPLDRIVNVHQDRKSSLRRAQHLILTKREGMRIGLFEKPQIESLTRLLLWSIAWIESRFQRRYRSSTPEAGKGQDSRLVLMTLMDQNEPDGTFVDFGFGSPVTTLNEMEDSCK